MARWLPAVAVILATIALAATVFRQPDLQPIDPSELASLQEELNATSAAAEGLSARIEALERAAVAAPAIDLNAELESVNGEIDDLAAGLEGACSSIGDLSNRIRDLQDALDGFSIPLPPSIGGRC
jgi:methyl-accepting chemotaxis protein